MKQLSLLSEVTAPGYLEGLRDYFQKRAIKDRTLLQTAPVDRNITLRWCLDNWGLIVREVRRELKEQRFYPQVRTKTEVILDRKRTIYSQPWPDKIVERALAQKLAEASEYIISPALHSHRKGHSSHKALQLAAAAIREQRNHGPLFIVQHDIQSYAASIPVDQLLQQIVGYFGTQENYTMKLLRAYMQPRYRSAEEPEEQRLTQGLPLGGQLTNMADNLYLADIDHILDDRALFYSRFGDDILLLFDSEATALAVDATLHQDIAQKGLRFHPKKSYYLTFTSPSHQGQFRTKQYCEYLGFRISSSGALSLPARKIRRLKDFLALHLKNQARILRQQGHTDEKLVGFLARSAAVLLQHRGLLPFGAELLSFVDDEEFLRSLDLWLAKRILSLSYHASPDSVFKRFSYHALRKTGLPSIRHIRKISARS